MRYNQATLYKHLEIVNDSLRSSGRKTYFKLNKADPRTRLGWQIEERCDNRIVSTSAWMNTRDMYHYIMGLGHGCGVGRWAD